MASSPRFVAQARRIRAHLPQLMKATYPARSEKAIEIIVNYWYKYTAFKLENNTRIVSEGLEKKRYQDRES